MKLKKKEIPQNILPIQQDKLFGYYYQFFRENTKSNSIILVSIKGGTPQMQSALRLQAIASSAKKQLFVEPILSVKRILYGEPSECNFTSYWQYMRSQKYEDVKTILENSWDFYGAIQLLEQWEDTLNFLNPNIKDVNISELEKLIEKVINALKMANHCFNLDEKSANKIVKDNSPQIYRSITEEINPYNLFLNIYTQCRIYYELNQMSNFLLGVSSFYDLVLEKIAKDNKIDQEEGYPKKGGRYDKRDFIHDRITKNPSKCEPWLNITKYLKSLDFWYGLRNDIIHHGKGISRESIKNYRKPKNACELDEILDVMVKIIQTDFKFLPDKKYHKYLGKDADYYIYSAVKKWVIDKLMNEGLK